MVEMQNADSKSKLIHYLHELVNSVHLLSSLEKECQRQKNVNSYDWSSLYIPHSRKPTNNVMLYIHFRSLKDMESTFQRKKFRDATTGERSREINR